jgi:hypothetical protein
LYHLRAKRYLTGVARPSVAAELLLCRHGIRCHVPYWEEPAATGEARPVRRAHDPLWQQDLRRWRQQVCLRLPFRPSATALHSDLALGGAASAACCVMACPHLPVEAIHNQPAAAHMCYTYAGHGGDGCPMCTKRRCTVRCWTAGYPCAVQHTH